MKYEQEAKDALENIFIFTNTDLKYINYAQVIDYMRWFLKNCDVKNIED